MKELAKLALILKSLGLKAELLDDRDWETDYNMVSVWVDLGKGANMSVWYYDKDNDFAPGMYEVHLNKGEECIYDTLLLGDMLAVVTEIGKRAAKYGK